jgi:hypothetical protein
MKPLSVDEAKLERIRVMGQDLGPTYEALWQEVASVHATWADYVELFGTKASRVELLNKVAPAFWRSVQDVFWENVLLHIARLTDRTTIAKRNTLTVQRLPDLMPNAEGGARVQLLVDEALSASVFARDWRNRRIAHADLDLALWTGAEPLHPASRASVVHALQALENVLNGVAKQFLDSESYFHAGDSQADAVLYVLNDGLHAASARRDRLLSGKYDPSEYQPRDV